SRYARAPSSAGFLRPVGKACHAPTPTRSVSGNDQFSSPSPCSSPPETLARFKACLYPFLMVWAVTLTFFCRLWPYIPPPRNRPWRGKMAHPYPVPIAASLALSLSAPAWAQPAPNQAAQPAPEPAGATATPAAAPSGPSAKLDGYVEIDYSYNF